MSLFSRLFGSKPKPVVKTLTFEEQLEHLKDHTDTQLNAVIQSDADISLRLAAIERLGFAQSLQQLALNEADSKIQGAARKRIGALLEQGDISVEEFKAAISDHTTQLAIASLSSLQSLQETLLADISDAALLFQLATEGASVKLRQLAAEKLQDADLLKQLLKASKGRDKGVYRIAKQKCDEIKAEEKKQQQLNERLSQLSDALSKHSQRTSEPQFVARTQHYQEQWQLLQQDFQNQALELDRECVSAIAASLEQCESFLNEQKQLAEQVLQQAQAVEAVDEQREAMLSAAKAILVDLYAGDEIDDDFEQAQRSALLDIQKSWNESDQLKASSNSEGARFSSICSAIEESLLRFKESGALLKQLAAMAAAQGEEKQQRCQQLSRCLKFADLLKDDERSQLLEEALQVVSEYRQQQKSEKQQQQDFSRHVNALIRKAHRAIDDGHLRQARGIHRSIEEKLAEPQASMIDVSSQIESLNEALAKLADWQSYAVQPKMESLVEQMQALQTSDMAPDALAAKIQRLQADWKSFSKGSGDQFQGLWEQFNAAAQEAYEPCKAYFEQLSELRQHYLKQRELLVSQLESYLAEHDWEKADWSAVEQLLRASKNQWRELSPVDRGAAKASQKAFDQVLANIQAYLDAEYDKNIALKKSLLVEAEQAATSDDVRSAVEKAKQLQSQWKAVGIVRRRDDQKVWKQFRAQCDAIFEKRQLQSDNFKAELDANKGLAEAIIEKAESLLLLEGAELLSAQATLQQYKSDYAELGALPRASSGAIEQRFQQVLQSFEQRCYMAKHQQQEQRWEQLFSLGEQLASYERELVSGTENNEVAESLEQLIADKSLLSEGRKVLQKRLSEAAKVASPDQSEAALKELCLRMEILADVESPADEQAARMAYQVERLQKGLGQASQMKADQIDALSCLWLAEGYVDESVYQGLFKRFDAARQQMMSK